MNRHGARHPARGATRGGARGEQGSGSVLVVAVVAATMLLLGILVPVSLVLAARQRVAGAADAAALAAADVASGAIAGIPCEMAARAAALAGAELASCLLSGAIARVTVSDEALGFTIAVPARAGPPGSR